MSVQVESLLFGGIHEPFLEHLLGWVLGQLEVVDTCIDRWVHVFGG